MIRTLYSSDLAEEKQQLEDDLEVLNEDLNDLTDELWPGWKSMRILQ
jgi:hypothetical protein